MCTVHALCVGQVLKSYGIRNQPLSQVFGEALGPYSLPSQSIVLKTEENRWEHFSSIHDVSEVMYPLAVM